MKLYVNKPTSIPNALVRIVMEFTDIRPEVVVATEEFRKTAEYKKLTVTDKFPLLVTPDGSLQESTAISKYFCGLAGGKLLGSNPVERSQVDQWISFGVTNLGPYLLDIFNGIFGWAPVTANTFNDSVKNIKAALKTLNTALEGRDYLVGNQLSLADLTLANGLLICFQTVLDAGFRKSMKNVTKWAESVYALEAFTKVLGRVQLCAKALKPVLAEEKKEVKKAAPAPAPAPKKTEEKPKSNVDLLPPTTFNLYDFKTFFVNHADKGGEAVDQWYKDLDWEGWAFWHLHYDKYEGEGEKIHVTNNLLGGFLNRAEHVNKITFARMGVFGEEPNLEIKGVWLMRGKDEIPDGLRKEHPQFEYYKTRKLDPRNNPEDDKLVREYFGGQEEGIIEGLKA